MMTRSQDGVEEKKAFSERRDGKRSEGMFGSWVIFEWILEVRRLSEISV